MFGLDRKSDAAGPKCQSGEWPTDVPLYARKARRSTAWVPVCDLSSIGLSVGAKYRNVTVKKMFVKMSGVRQANGSVLSKRLVEGRS